MKTLLLDSFLRICSLLSMEPCSGQQDKYQTNPVGNPSKEVDPSSSPFLYSIVAIFQRYVYTASFDAIYGIDFGGLMGTGFFAGIFALIGLWRYWGSSQWGWFFGLVLISWYITELVRKDFESKGLEGSNKALGLSCMALQAAVIVRGIQSFWA